jgi:hypothetical protein
VGNYLCKSIDVEVRKATTNDLGKNMEVGPLQQWCVSIVIPHHLEPIMGSELKDRKVLK